MAFFAFIVATFIGTRSGKKRSTEGVLRKVKEVGKTVIAGAAAGAAAGAVQGAAESGKKVAGIGQATDKRAESPKEDSAATGGERQS